MQQTLFIIILVIVLILAYGWKKKRENKMNDDLDVLIAADDWDGVCRILRKQLIIWGSLFMFSMVVLVVRIMDGGQYNCMRFLGMEILEGVTPLYNIIPKQENNGRL